MLPVRPKSWPGFPKHEQADVNAGGGFDSRRRDDYTLADAGDDRATIHFTETETAATWQLRVMTRETFAVFRC